MLGQNPPLFDHTSSGAILLSSLGSSHELGLNMLPSPMMAMAMARWLVVRRGEWMQCTTFNHLSLHAPK